MKRFIFLLLLAVESCVPKDGDYSFRILSTGDVHGRYFDTEYVSGQTRSSLMSASWYVDSVRTSSGRENVILLDIGDR